MVKKDIMLSSILDSVERIVYVVDIQNKSLIYINKQVENILGYTCEEIHKMGENAFSQIFHHEDIPEIKNQVSKLLNNKHLTEIKTTIRLKLKNEVYKRFETQITVFKRNKENNPVQLIAESQDVTERHEFVAKSETENWNTFTDDFIQLANGIKDGFFILDKYLNYTYWNKASEEITGIKAENVIGKNYQETAFDTASVISTTEAFRNVIATKIPRTQINCFEINNQEFYFESRIYPFREGVSVFSKDITQSLKIQKTLEESENNFRKMFENNIVAMMFIEPDTGLILDANDSAVNLYGYPKSVLVKKYLNEFTSAKSQPISAKLFGINKEEGNSFIYQHVTGNNIEKAVEIFFTPIDYANKRILFSIIHDITDRIIAEKELEKSENNLKQAEIIGKIGYWELNVSNNLLTWSDEIYTIFGCNPQEFASTYEAFLDFVHPDDRELVNNAYFAHIYNKKDYNIIHRILLKDNTIKYVNERCQTKFDDNGRPLISLGTVADVTEIKMAEFKLKEINEEYITINEELTNTINELNKAREETRNSDIRFKTLFELANDAIFIANENGRFVEVNQKACEMLECEHDEIIGTDMLNAISPEDLITNPLKINLLRENKSVVTKRFLVTKTGKILPVEISCKMLPDNYLQGIVRDISKQINHEHELIKAKERAEESEKLKAAFLQNISHEIRTPLNSILGFANMLSRADLSLDKRNNFAKIIQNSGNRLLSIINDILTVSSIETQQEKVNITKVNINEIITDLVPIFESDARNQKSELSTWLDLNNENAIIYTDKAKLWQILTHLITNAIKFTYKGQIECGYVLKDKYLEFFVKDNGIGIELNKIEKIFDRFVQADTNIQVNYGGTGLGLFICKGFVKLLGGKIWVVSQPNFGSTFYFTIPYKQVLKDTETIKTTKIKDGLPTLLIAEDEDYNFLFLEEFLNTLNYNVIHAKNGLEAVNICRNNLNINMILMDIKMPEMDGLTAAKLIKSFRPNLPIIAQSAYALDHEKNQYNDPCFDEYITKPIIASELRQKLDLRLKMHIAE